MLDITEVTNTATVSRDDEVLQAPSVLRLLQPSAHCHPNLLTFRWGSMLDGLGIERVPLHDARHSCATLMHLRQVPIAVIAE
jgi:integrase